MENWINLEQFSKTQQVLYFLDAIFWVAVYVLVEINVKKYKYVAIPAFSVTHNVAWEFVWSFMYKTELGELFVWGIRAWFLTDVWLVYRLWQYGDKQVSHPYLKKHFHLLMPIFILGWIVLFNSFLQQYPDPIGATTGYAVNLIMSLLYVNLFFQNPAQPALTLSIAVCKMFGTGFVGVGVWLGNTSAPFVIALAILTFIVDIWYCYLLMNRTKFIQE